MKRHVITAAHCVANADNMSSRGWTRNWKIQDRTAFTVRLGEFNFETEDETDARNYEVYGIHVHPDYKYQQIPFEMKNDIAILTLDRYENKLQPWNDCLLANKS